MPDFYVKILTYTILILITFRNLQVFVGANFYFSSTFAIIDCFYIFFEFLFDFLFEYFCNPTGLIKIISLTESFKNVFIGQLRLLRLFLISFRRNWTTLLLTEFNIFDFTSLFEFPFASIGAIFPERILVDFGAKHRTSKYDI